jgi:integrase
MLNDTQIRNIKPLDKAKKYADSGGLFLYVSATGSKLWRMAYSFNNKEKLLSFGKYPIVSLKDAREKRDAAKKMLANDIDPSRHKREMKTAAIVAEANTFKNVSLEWHETQTINNSEKDRARKLYILGRHVFPSIGRKPISQVTAQELLLIIKPLEREGKVLIAHRILQYCGMIFRYALATDRVERNIAADLRRAIRPHLKKNRSTITDTEKIGILLNKLDNFHGHFQVKCALRLYPLLFVRSAELSNAEWTEFRLESHEWHIPAERMKMGLPHIVPLSSQAMAILKELHLFSGHGKYLFPSRNSIRKPIHYSTPLQALRSLGYAKEEMCIHGFRSMASTLLNEQGFDPDWVERQLAHKDKDNSRAAYNHAQYLPQRHQMMQAWSDFLDSLREKTCLRHSEGTKII